MIHIETEKLVTQEPRAEYFHNYDLENIITPVKGHILTEKLKQAGYDEQEIDFLEDGFTNGFDIGYEGPTNRTSTSANIPLKVGNKTILWNKLMKEVKAKRVAGPYDKIPITNRTCTEERKRPG